MEIQTAWQTLKNKVDRKLYDQELKKPTNSDLQDILIYEHVSLAEMAVVNENSYSYSCRCGGVYIFESSEISTDCAFLINCSECSLHLKISLDPQS